VLSDPGGRADLPETQSTCGPELAFHMASSPKRSANGKWRQEQLNLVLVGGRNPCCHSLGSASDTIIQVLFHRTLKGRPKRLRGDERLRMRWGSFLKGPRRHSLGVHE